MNDIHVLKNTDDFTNCPECGYDGGFHNIFYNLNSEKTTRWILMCPSCHAKYDIGLNYPE